MKLRIPPHLVRIAAPAVVGTLARSWRFQVSGDEHWQRLRAAGQPFIYAVWHEVLLPMLWKHRGQGIAIVVSEARDGQYLSDYAARLGFAAVRGSSTRGGLRALLGAVRVLEGGGAVAFTPDGPRGPRRELKPGVVAAAQRGGAQVVPVHAAVSRAWRLRSWDRFCVPKPFARVRVQYGPPVAVAPGAEGLDAGVRTVTAALGALAQALES